MQWGCYSEHVRLGRSGERSIKSSRHLTFKHTQEQVLYFLNLPPPPFNTKMWATCKFP